jgi:hypothetical protein
VFAIKAAVISGTEHKVDINMLKYEKVSIAAAAELL